MLPMRSSFSSSHCSRGHPPPYRAAKNHHDSAVAPFLPHPTIMKQQCSLPSWSPSAFVWRTWATLLLFFPPSQQLVCPRLACLTCHPQTQHYITTLYYKALSSSIWLSDKTSTHPSTYPPSIIAHHDGSSSLPPWLLNHHSFRTSCNTYWLRDR